MNRWNIPNVLEREVTERDKKCIYCGIEFGKNKQTRKSMPTWEHIVNDARIISRENIARCCFSCNSSKGAKELSLWLESKYCNKKGISKDSVAEVVKKALADPPQVIFDVETEAPSHLPQKETLPKRFGDFDLNRLIEIEKDPNHRESDRGFVLLSSADLENSLTNLLQNWFESSSQLSKGDRKALFDFTGPLGSFSSKIYLGKAMGLLGVELSRDLHLIRKTRNMAAHSNSAFSLSANNIKSLTGSLFYQGDTENSLQRYSIVKSWSEKVETVPREEYNESEMKGRGFLRFDRVKFQLAVLMIKIELSKAEIVVGAVGPRVGELWRNDLAQVEQKYRKVKTKSPRRK